MTKLNDCQNHVCTEVNKAVCILAECLAYLGRMSDSNAWGEVDYVNL